MATLNVFEKEQKELVIRLPYLAGYWLSRADDSGGEDADAQEKEALYQVIKKAASGKITSGFIHIVFAGLYMKKAQWDAWQDIAPRTLDECNEVLGFMKERLPAEDLEAYRKIIMEIAVSVARAFREYEEAATIWGRIYARAEYGYEFMMRLFNPKKYPKLVICPNISPDERKALRELHQALYSV